MHIARPCRLDRLKPLKPLSALSLALLASATKPLDKLHFDLFYSARFSHFVVSEFLAY